ncbi:phosphoadenosine phosphosulfate reductase [Nonomuraea sp. SBT364]|uniref:phosphoadenosine phosphosulfate reductase n=1 Tax=Nonomuraea sp. SBT364 TaxID=1580530 RepID=UPI0009EA3751|nr:phosphoadenosine phosphosulfate reductase [Nonomuraea sp. SBT364]
MISYGGGVQSTALLVLAAQRRIDFPTFLFANVGDDSEHPSTLAYVREIATGYAREHGIDIHEIQRRRRDGSIETLWERLHRAQLRSIPIPIRMDNGAPGRRSCTSDFKIKVVAKWLKDHGATANRPATVGIGISLDEIHRANKRRSDPYEQIEYPLLDLALRRDDCVQIITAAGLPVPPKSACFFCPFKTVDAWRHQRRHEPVLFAKSEELEATLNEKRAMLGRDAAYLTRYGTSLNRAIQLAPQESETRDPGCDSGWCMT